MTHRQFLSLNQQEQIEAIKLDGSFLSVRNEAGVDVVLYQVGSFYAEVFFETDESDKLLIRSFDDTSSLDVYLASINISFLEKLL